MGTFLWTTLYCICMSHRRGQARSPHAHVGDAEGPWRQKPILSIPHNMHFLTSRQTKPSCIYWLNVREPVHLLQIIVGVNISREFKADNAKCATGLQFVAIGEIIENVWFYAHFRDSNSVLLNHTTSSSIQSLASKCIQHNDCRVPCSQGIPACSK
jgi:hypothetical protein